MGLPRPDGSNDRPALVFSSSCVRSRPIFTTSCFFHNPAKALLRTFKVGMPNMLASVTRGSLNNVWTTSRYNGCSAIGFKSLPSAQGTTIPVHHVPLIALPHLHAD